MPSPLSRFAVNASWLIKLRWVAVIGQVITIAIVLLLLKIQLDTLWALSVVIGLTAFSNLVLNFWLLRWNRKEDQNQLWWDYLLGLVMVMDMLSLTALLFATGGPANPFYLFFFVNLSLCAVVLTPNWAWALNLLSILCFAFLLYDHHQLEELDLGFELVPIRERGSVSLFQFGVLAAFGTCSSVIVYFMTRVTVELREQQREVQRVEAQQARSEKLEALGTLAAGTAHELATPLSTIAVVARDVEKAFDEHPPDFPGAEDVVEDIHLIRNQLDRCRNILDRMASHSGQVIGENFQSVLLSDLVEEVLSELPDRDRIKILLDPETSGQSIKAPRVRLSQAIRGLIQNAIDADETSGSVELLIKPDGEFWNWSIQDFGSGMAEDVLERISEPFFTTKPPGKGMGLGVFLAQNVIQRLGGRIEFTSSQNEGTRVTIYLVRTIKTE